MDRNTWVLTPYLYSPKAKREWGLHRLGIQETLLCLDFPDNWAGWLTKAGVDRTFVEQQPTMACFVAGASRWLDGLSPSSKGLLLVHRPRQNGQEVCYPSFLRQTSVKSKGTTPGRALRQSTSDGKGMTWNVSTTMLRSKPAKRAKIQPREPATVLLPSTAPLITVKAPFLAPGELRALPVCSTKRKRGKPKTRPEPRHSSLIEGPTTILDAEHNASFSVLLPSAIELFPIETCPTAAKTPDESLRLMNWKLQRPLLLGFVENVNRQVRQSVSHGRTSEDDRPVLSFSES
jgi:hypothetical protein